MNLENPKSLTSEKLAAATQELLAELEKSILASQALRLKTQETIARNQELIAKYGKNRRDNSKSSIVRSDVESRTTLGFEGILT